MTRCQRVAATIRFAACLTNCCEDLQIKATGCADHLHFVRAVNIGVQNNHWQGIAQNQEYWASVVVSLVICAG